MPFIPILFVLRFEVLFFVPSNKFNPTLMFENDDHPFVVPFPYHYPTPNKEASLLSYTESLSYRYNLIHLLIQRHGVPQHILPRLRHATPTEQRRGVTKNSRNNSHTEA